MALDRVAEGFYTHSVFVVTTSILFEFDNELLLLPVFQGCASSPRIRIYQPETLDEELQQVSLQNNRASHTCWLK